MMEIDESDLKRIIAIGKEIGRLHGYNGPIKIGYVGGLVYELEQLEAKVFGLPPPWTYPTTKET